MNIHEGKKGNFYALFGRVGVFNSYFDTKA